MAVERDKVVVAMSGGVDSSVSACLLVEQGYDVVGLFMRHGASAPEPAAVGPAAVFDRATSCTSGGCSAETENEGHSHAVAAVEPKRSHQGCCSASDASDARFVAGLLGIPFYALNFEHDFDELIDYFADEYARGRTPNPCVVCNDKLKFGRIVEYADAVGARYIATGHYARTQRRDGRNVLLRAVDEKKDQSYVLFGLSRRVLDRVMFPIGALTKPQVRAIAARYDLPNRDKPDSVEICFVPDRDYARVVRARRPEAFRAGNVVDAAGNVVGRHDGLPQYTVGQRRGLGIAAGRPVYVTQLNVESNTITLGDENDLACGALIAERVNMLVEAPKCDPHRQASLLMPRVAGAVSFRAQVKIRYLHAAAPATVSLLDGGRARVVFDEPQRAVTPGQAVVFYDGDVVLGGGWIESGNSPSSFGS
jgi:tRNA-uridine 2-sulfurtransferase